MGVTHVGDALRVLVVEDSEDDTILLLRELRRGGYDPVHERVDTAAALNAALDRQAWDVIIADYVIPGFGGMEALEIVKKRQIDVPFIMISGKVGEHVAVEVMKAGAHDYITKGNLSRFIPAIRREIRDAVERQRAREEIERWQQDWEDIFQSISDPAMILDPDFRVLAVNRAGVAAIGRRKEDIVGRCCYLVVHGMGAPPERCPMRHLLASGLHTRVEMEVDLFGGVSLVSCTPMFSRDGRLVKAIYIATDITELKRIQRELEESLKRSQRSLYSMVDTMTLMCEMKDPYTAGHQRGVSRLACAIAEEMGLPQDQVEGIRVAALLHDIGKIFIPAEILSKPGVLSEGEISIMRTHVQAGYRVLKGIESPWPIAQVALQHHERMDGSGYPSGLSGEEILLEARIVGVADVVDAMASHRPYRPAIGIDQVRKEILLHRGTHFDADVVDACLKVLRREEFDSGSSQKEAYREALLAVTGGRLRLVELKAIQDMVASGELLAFGEAGDPMDIPRARQVVAGLPMLPSSRRRAILLCLSEALANAVKHAGSGKWGVLQARDRLRVVVEDSGPGIELTELPRATLMQHYSTKESLGSGFTLMLYYSDRIYLATGFHGTSIVLEFELHDHREKKETRLC